MDDQRIGKGATLGFKDACYCQGVKGIAGQSIDRLRWQPHNTPVPQECHGVTDPVSPMNNPGTHLKKDFRNVSS